MSNVIKICADHICVYKSTANKFLKRLNEVTQQSQTFRKETKIVVNTVSSNTPTLVNIQRLYAVC